MDQVGARLTLRCDSAFLALAEKGTPPPQFVVLALVKYETQSVL